MLRRCLLGTGTVPGAPALSGGRVLTFSTRNLLGAQAVRRTSGSWATACQAVGPRGSLAPYPRYLRHAPPVSGKCFLLDPLGLPPPLTASPPQSAPYDEQSFGTSCGATGTARTIGHGHRVPSNAGHLSPPGCSSNLPGQGVTGFPAVDRDSRRPSARRSASSRSSPSDPYSTCDIASASRWWPARSAIWRCISWATQR